MLPVKRGRGIQHDEQILYKKEKGNLTNEVEHNWNGDKRTTSES